MPKYVDIEQLQMISYINTEDMEDTFDNGVEWVMKRLNEIAAVDVKPTNHGSWIEKHGVLHPLELDGICSQCGYATSFYHNYSYCPNCGAKMNEEHEETTVSKNQIEKYRDQVLAELTKLAAPSSTILLLTDQLIIRSIEMKRKPEDIAWVLVQ